MTNAYKTPKDPTGLSGYLDDCKSNQNPFYSASLRNNIEALLYKSPTQGQGDVLERILFVCTG